MRRSTSIRWLWHAACLTTLPACFYVKPLPEVEVNEPPDILEPELDPQPVELRRDTLVLSVIAADPEAEAVFCAWPDLDNVDADITRTPSGDVWVCRAEILEPDALESDIVRALVFDGHRDNVVTVRWQVVSP